jgi:hypothetical protein
MNCNEQLCCGRRATRDRVLNIHDYCAKGCKREGQEDSLEGKKREIPGVESIDRRSSSSTVLLCGAASASPSFKRGQVDWRTRKKELLAEMHTSSVRETRGCAARGGGSCCHPFSQALISPLSYVAEEAMPVNQYKAVHLVSLAAPHLQLKL